MCAFVRSENLCDISILTYLFASVRIQLMHKKKNARSVTNQAFPMVVLTGLEIFSGIAK